jgi:tetratricopeptide (TPR) repeat protein
MSKQESVSEEYYKRSLSLAKIEDYEEAAKYFDKAIQLDPNNILAWKVRQMP